MRLNRNAFGVKLWRSFVLYAAVIFGTLWLLQTVFLQNFYDAMAIGNVKNAAARIVDRLQREQPQTVLDDAAYHESLLVFLTDFAGNVLYSADEHSFLYREKRTWHMEDERDQNPYRSSGEPMNWQIGAYRSLPQGYGDFLRRLSGSESGAVGYPTENNAAYVYGMTLPAKEPFAWMPEGGAALYVSIPLGAVGATVDILRVQLIWVTVSSLLIGSAIALFLSRRFARPIWALSARAGRMAEGNFEGGFEKGFCLELDALSDTLDRTAAALARAENDRRELLANVSHDLRTPLTMIKGYAEIIREISWADEEKRGEDLTIIIREADRLTGLVNEILEYSALKAVQSPMALERVNLSAAAGDVVEQFAPLCGHGGCAIEAAIAPGLWVDGNEKQLVRVLYNLIDNAVSHAGDDRRVQVAVKVAGAAVRVTVRDFGTGISPDELPYIWDRYFTSKQRGGKKGGSGLGLAIAKEILILHKAEFGVESEPGQGSLFWFELKKEAAAR